MDRTVDQFEAGIVPLPTVRRVGANRPFAWLSLGWQDLRRAAAPSLGFGFCVAAFGAVLLLRVAAGWQGRRAAIGTLLGFACALAVVVGYALRSNAGAM